MSDDQRGGKAYAGYLEARAMDATAAVTNASLKELGWWWYLGEENFARKVLDGLSTCQLYLRIARWSLDKQATKPESEGWGGGGRGGWNEMERERRAQGREWMGPSV